MAPEFPPSGAAAYCALGSAALPPKLRYSTAAVAATTCASVANAVGFGSLGPLEFEGSPIGRSGEWSFGADR